MYDAFIPGVAEIDVGCPGYVAGVVSQAETAITDLNRAAGPGLMPFARLLLRTGSIASSKSRACRSMAAALPERTPTRRRVAGPTRRTRTSTITRKVVGRTGEAVVVDLRDMRDGFAAWRGGFVGSGGSQSPQGETGQRVQRRGAALRRRRPSRTGSSRCCAALRAVVAVTSAHGLVRALATARPDARGCLAVEETEPRRCL